MMNKYQFDEELKPYSFFNFNIGNEWIVSKMNVLLQPPLSLFVRKDIDVKVLKFKHHEMYEITPKKLTGIVPCLLFIHGGGFVMDGAPYHFDYAIQYAKALKCKVFYIRYRLAPTYPYPCGLLDCFHALKYILKHYQLLNLDKDKIGFIGDSAGGNLVAALNLLAKEKLNFTSKFQVLIYPVIDQFENYQSKIQYIDTPNWNSKLNKMMWKAYIKDETTTKYASLMENTTLIQVPTYIETCEFDCLHDEAIQYALYLKKMGCEVILNETKGTFHGYDVFSHLNISKKAVQTRIMYMKKHFN